MLQGRGPVGHDLVQLTIRGQRGNDEPTGRHQIRKLVLGLRDITSVLADADPKLKAEVYAELGVSITYDTERRLVSVTAGLAPVYNRTCRRGVCDHKHTGHLED